MTLPLASFRRLVGKAGILFLLLAAVALIVHNWPGFDENALAEYIRDKGPYGIILYLAVAAVGSAIGIPRQGLSFAAGYAFGALYGAFWATLGVTLGCAGSFFITRFFGKPFVPQRLAWRMEKLDAFLVSAPFTMTVTVRSLPIGNNALTNILAGLCSIPAVEFIAGSFVGYIPQNFIFALLGSGMRVDPFWRSFIAAALFILATAIGIALFRRHKASLPEEAEAKE